MKKLIATALAVVCVLAITLPSADAQPIVLCGYCCDISGTPRCIVPEMVCGYACYCNGVSGVGTAC